MNSAHIIKSIVSGFSDCGSFDDVEKFYDKSFKETVDIVFKVLDFVENIKISKLKLLFTLIDEINSEYPDYLDKNFVISCLVYGHWHEIFHKYFDEIGIDEFFDKIFINLEHNMNSSEFESLYKTLNENGISLSDESLEKILNQMNYEDENENHPLLNCLYKIYNSLTKIPHQIIFESVPGQNRINYLESIFKYKDLKLKKIPNIDEVKNLFYSINLNTKNSEDFKKVQLFYDSISVLPLTDICKVSCLTNNNSECICEEAESMMFKYYGPVNSSNGCCSEYSGCRMLLCSQYQEIDENDESENLDWYTGLCGVCENKIAKKCYSVRFAREDGGWSGCYCSTDCVKILKMTKKESNLNEIIANQLLNCCIFDSQ